MCPSAITVDNNKLCRRPSFTDCRVSGVVHVRALRNCARESLQWAALETLDVRLSLCARGYSYHAHHTLLTSVPASVSLSSLCTKLCRFSPLRLCTSAPLHLCAFAPLFCSPLSAALFSALLSSLICSRLCSAPLCCGCLALCSAFDSALHSPLLLVSALHVSALGSASHVAWPATTVF